MFSFDTLSLKKWFIETKRDFPWREAPTPYRVWISEVMLQQTQASVVIPYFERWMEKFPTIQKLASTPLDDVLKMWEGLGYYSRARALHAVANTIVASFQGELPQTEESLRSLPGLGPYTVGAIRSFAFHQRAAAVDGNVIRVLSRYFLVEEDISKPKTIKKIWEMAQAILPEAEPWVVSEALIELGATVCTRVPRCQECPVRRNCQAYLQGKTSELPYKSRRMVVQSLYRAVAVVRCGEFLLVQKGALGKIMSDLHEFPYWELPQAQTDVEAVLQLVEKEFRLSVKLQKVLPEVPQAFTRYRLTLFPFVLYCESIPDIPGYQWQSISYLQQRAFSSGHRRIFQEVTRKDKDIKDINDIKDKDIDD